MWFNRVSCLAALLALLLLAPSANGLDTCSSVQPNSSKDDGTSGSCKGAAPTGETSGNEPGILSTVPTRSTQYRANLEVNDPLVNEIGQRPIDNSIKVKFTLHANGQGADEGIAINSVDFANIDEIISKYCCDLMSMQPSRCAPNSGARLINEAGVRMLSFNDVEEGQRVYCVPQGVHFVWPMKKTGYVFYPKNVKTAIEGRPIKMKQLSENVRAFSVDNFVSDDEIEDILRSNRNRMTPSEVGFGGWRDDTRTSSTSWDFTSKASKAIQKRTFELLGMDFVPELSDTLQVLRYTSDGGMNGMGQWYKPHVDWFHSGGYDGHDPKVENGTNRFATMFLYLSTVPKGGATVFPLSTTHEGYNGEKLVHDGTVNTPGYIDTKEAKYCCNETSTALRSNPIKGNAVLFYSQGPDGTLDPWSLHGGCPPVEGEKWSANVWVWNRPRPDKSKAKDMPKNAKKPSHPLEQRIVLKNMFPFPVDLYWDSNAPVEGLQDLDLFTENFRSDEEASLGRFHTQGSLPSRNPGYTISSYLGHVFIAVDKTSKRVVWVGKVEKTENSKMDEDDTKAVVMEIA